MLENWKAEALNTAPDSANEIHGDSMAQQYGFQGGLVPGVTISAYLVHPAVSHWGLAWLTHGRAHVRVSSPLYDGEHFEVQLDDVTESSYRAALYRPSGILSATAEVSLVDDAPPAPARRNDPVVAADFQPPTSSFEVWEELQQKGCKAFRYLWDGGPGELKYYLRDLGLLPPLLQPDGAGYANLSFLLGCSNWILAGNAHMNPWVHLETTSQNYAPVSPNTAVITEMTVDGWFEKKGHQFIDVSVGLFDEKSDLCYMTTTLRAIFKLRGQ